eukprot:CCRYP_021206-RA/>CCRYP_021206-RA protein AED:0.00 eAED:0.00 QI:34/0/0.5/1/0/0/2/181/218
MTTLHEFDEDQELQRRLNPTTPEDFAKLQTELLQWKHRQERKINVTARNPEHKQTMMAALLKKEAYILRKIASLKHLACEKWRAERLDNIMEKMSQPKKWGGADGSFLWTWIHQKRFGREMKDMYQELRNTADNEDRSRIELLHRAKALIEKLCDHSSLAKDVCSLMDRELEMLGATEMGKEFMAGLRMRMLNAFAKLAMKACSPRGKNPKLRFRIDA